jgi:hypothetical protein
VIENDDLDRAAEELVALAARVIGRQSPEGADE